ncbi:MAG: hypothetical protein QOF68_2863 [Gaiellales bacterium]|nr:hypothetical protein [Gaiellales bacterium]
MGPVDLTGPLVYADSRIARIVTADGNERSDLLETFGPMVQKDWPLCASKAGRKHGG